MERLSRGLTARTKSSSRRYVGWLVCCSDPAQERDRKVARVRTHSEGVEVARLLNAAAVAGCTIREAAARHLYWCEWWSTASALTQ